MPITKIDVIEIKVPDGYEVFIEKNSLISFKKKKSTQRLFRVYKFNGFVEIARSMDGSKPDIFGVEWLTEWQEW